MFKRLLAWLRRQPPDIGGTHWALIGILVLVGIVLAILLGIALRGTAARWSNTSVRVSAPLDKRRTL